MRASKTRWLAVNVNNADWHLTDIWLTSDWHLTAIWLTSDWHVELDHISALYRYIKLLSTTKLTLFSNSICLFTNINYLLLCRTSRRIYTSQIWTYLTLCAEERLLIRTYFKRYLPSNMKIKLFIIKITAITSTNPSDLQSRPLTVPPTHRRAHPQSRPSPPNLLRGPSHAGC